MVLPSPSRFHLLFKNIPNKEAAVEIQCTQQTGMKPGKIGRVRYSRDAHVHIDGMQYIAQELHSV